ncbi:MAG: hypothetical protein MK105_05615 [Crocinitomicaceae bacterium]|nr:hypothetical protein [Crocinitomicaceae bacterium]
MDYYNHEHYPYEHFGLTPYDVLEGEKPNKFTFREQIKKEGKTVMFSKLSKTKKGVRRHHFVYYFEYLGLRKLGAKDCFSSCQLDFSLIRFLHFIFFKFLIERRTLFFLYLTINRKFLEWK